MNIETNIINFASVKLNSTDLVSMVKNVVGLKYESPLISEHKLNFEAVLCASDPSFGDYGDPGTEPGLDDDFNF